MVKFAFTYAKVLALLLLAMGVYCATVVPAIGPTSEVVQNVPLQVPPLPSEYWWQEFFEEGSWQRESPKVINTKQGVLISKTWEQLDKKTWKLMPLTLIMPQSSKDQAAVYQASTLGSGLSVADKEMWIVSADEGATIHFEEEPSLGSGGVPTVNRGDLSGRIEVTRKTPSQAEEQPWRLIASDLSINRRQVTTENEVLIEWGNSIIRGRSLRILLQGNLLSSQQEESDWGPLDELELYNVDEIKLELPPGGLWADMNVGRFKTEPELRKLPACLRATAGGRFSFDFKQSTAKLQNGVKLIHELGDLPPDEFSCDYLTLKVDPPSKQSADTQLSVREFEAFGVDSLRNFVGEKWVEVIAPTLQLSARAKTLKVDLSKQRVALAGKLNQPGATQSSVKLQYEGYEFQAPKIEYQAAPDNAEVEHLGWMVAEGQGELRTSDEGQIGASHVRWQNSLRMTPAPDGPGEWIELDGNTLIESKQHGFLASDRLEIWLRKSGQTLESPNTIGLASEYVPTRVYSASKTVLAADALKAQVDELDVSVEYYAPDPVLDGNGQAQGQQATAEPIGLSLQDAAGNPMYQFVTPPGQVSEPARETQSGAASLSSPISVTGKRLSATIGTNGASSWIDQLAISGPVKVWQEAQEADAVPWHAEGNLMLAETNRAGQVDMQVEGKPAKIVLADGVIEGPAIRVNQEHNIVLIDHPGECKLPKSLLRQNLTTGGLSGGQFEWVDSPKCSWRKRLLFDGKRVMIEGEVDFSGSLLTEAEQYWLITGNCQRMDLVLQESVSLSATTPEKAAIQDLVLRDNVNVFASELDARGEKQSRQHLYLPELTFNVPTEELIGKGTGWIKSWFVENGRLGRLASSEESQLGLRAAHLQFRDRLLGRLGASALTFEGKVELFTNKIASWEEPVDLVRASRLQAGEFLLNADTLQVFDTTQLSSSRLGGAAENWEFLASGNVAFNGYAETGEFSGTGERLSYQQSKDQLVLRGTERDPAFVQQKTDGPNGRVYEGNLTYVEIDATTMTPSNVVLGAGGIRVDNQPGGALESGQTLPQANGAVDPRRASDYFYNRRQP